MSDSDYVRIKTSDLLTVLRDLEMMVVSLDRIGSIAADVEEATFHRISSNFLIDWKVCRRLASARRVLSDPFPDDVGEDGMDVLERELRSVKKWTFKQQKP